MTQHRVFGLATAISMIVGIVVGSGIFFKADDILLATGGNIHIGLMLLGLGAAAIIFGALSFTEYALRSSGEGGLLSYYDEFISPKVGAGFGFFQSFVYLPTLMAVVAWINVIFIARLFSLDLNLAQQCLGAVVLIFALLLINVLSRKLGAFCQTAATVLKLIPLIVIAVLGLSYQGEPIGASVLDPGAQLIPVHDVGLAWLASLAPIAFSFDGWTLSLTISPEVKDAKKTMPRALVLGPLIVLAAYLLYLSGLTKILGAEAIMTLGDASLDSALGYLFGPFAAKLMLVFIVIAILGVCNGLLIAGIRMPQALAEKAGILPESFAKRHERYDISLPSALLYLAITLFWLAAHYLLQNSGILNGRDITEIAIIFSYLCYIILYVKLIMMYKNKQVTSVFTGIICPIFASIGSLIMFVGGLISSPFYVGLDIAICAVVFIVGMYLYSKSARRV